MEQLIQELFNFGIEDFTFTNLPKRIDISAYEATQSEFINYYTKIKGVISIYKYGGGSVPGLSDLDFIVALDDEYKHRYGIRYDKHFFSSKSQYILTHSQLFLSNAGLAKEPKTNYLRNMSFALNKFRYVQYIFIRYYT